MPYRTMRPGAAESRRGRKPFQHPHAPPKIPIVDAYRRVIGWTAIAPEIVRGMLRHLEAEGIFRRPIVCVYVELERFEDAAAAGAPPDWRGPWRCLAIAPEGTASLAALLAAATHGRPQA